MSGTDRDRALQAPLPSRAASGRRSKKPRNRAPLRAVPRVPSLPPFFSSLEWDCTQTAAGDIQLTYMPQQTTVRFTDEDLALLDALQAKTGIVSRAEILRRAIRVFAEHENVVPGPRARRRKGR